MMEKFFKNLFKKMLLRKIKRLEKKLNKYEERISKVLDKNNSQVILTSELNNNEAAKYLYLQNIIAINVNIHHSLSLNLLADLSHESRHAYQYQLIEGLIKNENDEHLISQWKEEYNNIINPPENILNEESLKEYALQSIEVDAYAFSELMVQKIAKRTIWLNFPDWLRAKVEKRKKEIKIKK